LSNPNPIITLTTDFGAADGTVGAMVGVIKSICPSAEVVTIASDVPAHDIPRGAWAMMQATPFFPAHAIHVGVVDPGVGSDRRGLLVTADRGSYIGPDNGLLSWALRRCRPERAFTLENPDYRIAPIGVTFDGRDLFAAAAAHLAAGADPKSFGRETDSMVELRWPEPRVGERRIRGEILMVDHFGNLITNIPLTTVAETFADTPARVVLANGMRARMCASYADIEGTLGAVINGTGLIEIAGHETSAARLAGCARGDRVTVELQDDDE
jgi:S-adenosylmethionine hydrolase